MMRDTLRSAAAGADAIMLMLLMLYAAPRGATRRFDFLRALIII